ncbi:MAG: hypothetical protein AUG49_02875 [Catenulispora sp. 13_1_20CM_3_70_7]|nr:MAG: hypothetical protein AUG49_02875 [Catenulispora sp. 13_1_20CM_3_70_7]
MASTHPSSPARPRGGRPPRRFGSSAAPDAVLDLPGSAKVSCLLMEDAVAAGQVSVGSGDGKVALFANPFLDGKEEALVVTGSGALTYLRRTGSETGWEQSPVVFADGEPVSAVEVVVVQHPQDLTLWAVFVAGADGQPHALQLAGPAADEGPCTWEYRREALSLAATLPVLNTLSHLSVFYDGRAPHITAIDPVTGNIATIFTVTNAPQRFSCQVWWISASKTGPVEEVAGGRANGLQVCYARVGSTILRFDLPPGEPVQQPVTVATDAYRLVGTFPPVAPAGVGFVYLDKAQVRNLVAVNWRSWSSGPIRTRTPGLGLHTAKCWVDVNQMLHVYGLDPDNTLKVLHQASWDSNNLPVWSAATIRPVPPVPPHTAHTADGLSKSTVPSCVGLVPKVAMFALDPFPDHRPSQLVKLEGVTPSGDAQFALHTQDVTSTQWSRDKVRLPVTGTPQMVTHYVSSVTVLDRRGNPMPGLPVDISAESVVEIQCEGASYLVGPGHSARLATNPLGRITIATSADSLLPAVLHVDAPGLERGAIIQPAAAVHAYLGGSGTLPSQQGYFTADALRDAKAGGAPIVDPKHHASLAGVVASTKNLFELADGGQATSKLFRGVGAAPPIHGFAVGSAPSHPRATADVTVGYTEFHSPVEVHNHLKGIRELPEYGGVWDDFTAWAGDVWEGIKNGVVKVYEVVVEAVAAVFIWIGDKIVELVGFVVDSIVTAVRAVEAVIREVVDTIVKVVDWLKALFGFEDIWDTKRALEAGLHMMMNHLAATISHYGDDLHGWFLKQETKAHDLFEKLKDEFRDRPMGDAANRIPAVTDTSGQVIATGDLQSNPQATWLLDRAFTPGAVPDGSLENLKLNLDPKLTAAWDAFVAKVSDAKIIDDFGAILGDLGTVLAQLVDPADPELAVKTSLIALIDVLDRLIHIGLVLADAALQAVVTLIVTLVNCMDALLATALPLGPISRLFTWIQTRAGIEQPDDLTLGGLICLIPAFAVTVVHKLVNGVESPRRRRGRPDGRRGCEADQSGVRHHHDRLLDHERHRRCRAAV